MSVIAFHRCCECYVYYEWTGQGYGYCYRKHCSIWGQSVACDDFDEIVDLF